MMEASIFATQHVLTKHAKHLAQARDQWMGSYFAFCIYEWHSQLLLTQQALNCQLLQRAQNDEVGIALLQDDIETSKT